MRRLVGQLRIGSGLRLTPGASLVVELRDVSLADAAAKPLFPRQTIANPGQVPIEFQGGRIAAMTLIPETPMPYRPELSKSDGRLAFINDTAYHVITRGNPSRVDMVLVLVQPPPDQIEGRRGLAKMVGSTGAGGLGEPDPERGGASCYGLPIISPP